MIAPTGLLRKSPMRSARNLVSGKDCREPHAPANVTGTLVKS